MDTERRDFLSMIGMGAMVGLAGCTGNESPSENASHPKYDKLLYQPSEDYFIYEFTHLNVNQIESKREQLENSGYESLRTDLKYFFSALKIGFDSINSIINVVSHPPATSDKKLNMVLQGDFDKDKIRDKLSSEIGNSNNFSLYYPTIQGLSSLYVAMQEGKPYVILSQFKNQVDNLTNVIADSNNKFSESNNNLDILLSNIKPGIYTKGLVYQSIRAKQEGIDNDWRNFIMASAYAINLLEEQAEYTRSMVFSSTDSVSIDSIKNEAKNWLENDSIEYSENKKSLTYSYKKPIEEVNFSNMLE